MNLTNGSPPAEKETSAAAQLTQPDTDDEFLEVFVETSDANPTDQEETTGKRINGTLSTQNQTSSTVQNHIDSACNGDETECIPSERESHGEEQHGPFDTVKEGMEDTNDSELALKTLYANLKAFREKENDPVISFPLKTFKKLEEVTEIDGKTYKCSVCAMQFARHSSLTWHMQSHEVSQNLKGRKSDQDHSFSVETHNRYPRTASSDEPIIIRGNLFICGLCYKEFEFLRSVRFHITRCHKFEVPVDPAPDFDLNSTTCNICDREFESTKALRVHSSHMHTRIDNEQPNENGAFGCPMCEKEFASTRARKLHVAMSHRLSLPLMPLNESNAPNEFGMFSCNVCNKEFSSNTARKIHEAHMHKRIDDLVFNTVSSLNTTPKEDGSYNCDHCDKIFDTVKGKSVHMSHMHKLDSQSNDTNNVASADPATDENGIFSCDYCDKKFDSEKGRRVHVTRLHKFEAPEDPASDEDTAAFTCDYCFREFGSAKAVSVHIWHAHRFASKMKQSVDSLDETSIPYEKDVFGCEFCDRMFESARARLIHTSHVHKNSSIAETTQNDSFGEEGPAECDLCGKEFNSLKAVKIHKAHKHPFANALYYCKPCSKPFPSLRAQKAHMLRLHEGQSCDYSVVELEKNGPVSNGESMLPCHLCERTFYNKKGLSRHLGYHASTQQLLSQLSDTCKDVLLAPMDNSTTPATDNYPSVLSADENLVSESFQCPICKKTGFESRKAVKIHSSRMHSGIELEFDGETTPSVEERDALNFPFDCDYCEKKFRTEYGKNVHKFRVHKLEIKRNSSGSSLVKGNEMDTLDSQEQNGVLPDEQESLVLENSSLQNSIDNTGESEKRSSISEQFDCLYCDRSFTNVKARSAHLKVHIRHGRQEAADTIQESVEKVVQQLINNTVGEPPKTLENVEIFNHVKDHASSSVSTHTSLLENVPMEIDSLQSVPVRTNPPKARVYKVTHAKENIFKCHRCPKAFNKTKALANHLRIHEFQCQLCSKAFISIKTLRIHMKKHGHNYGTNVSMFLTNDKIGDQFAKNVDVAAKLNVKVVADCGSNASVVENAEIQVKQEELKCPHCPRSFKNLKAISTHSRSHSENKNVSTNSTPPIVNSVEMATENNEFRCLYCKRLFSNAKAVAVHSRIHKNNGQFIYPKEVLPTPDKVSTIVNEIKHFKCSICSKTFDTEKGLHFHANVHSSHVHKCMYCGRLFNNVKGLAGHMKIHRGGVKELLEVTLGKEDEIEEAAAPAAEQEDVNESCDSYPCKYCERVFTTRRGLARHSFIHTSEMPLEPGRLFACRYCGVEFASGKQLGGHMRHHSLILQKDPNAYNSIVVDIDGTDAELNEEDQFICDTCDEVFECREDLSEHVRSHTLDPLLMNDAEETQDMSVSDQRDSLSAALTAHTGYMMCHICNQLFSSGEILNVHMYKKHRWANRKSTSSLPQKDLSTTVSAGLNQNTALTSSRKRSFSPELVDLESDSTEDPIFVPGAVQSKRVCTPEQTPKIVSSAGAKSAFGLRNNGEIYAKNQPNLSAQFWESSHECMFCKKRFSGKAEFLEHVRTHPESREYDNEDLENYTSTQDSESFVLQNHDGNDEHFVLEQNEEKDGYRCTECEETFQDKLQMLIHISYHRDSKLPNGEQKSLLIKADSSLLAPYKCNFCGQRFINKKYRNIHLCKHHRSDILQCEICQKLFLCKETLKQHQEQHDQEKRYQCEFCGECFASKSVLQRHTEMQCQTGDSGIVDTHQDEQNTEVNTDTLPVIKQEPRQIEDDFEENEPESPVHSNNTPSRNTTLPREESRESSYIEQKFKQENVYLMSYICSCCNKRFASDVEMQNHENQPQRILYCCGLCNLYFVDCKSAEVHSKMHVMETDLDLD